MRSLGLHHQRHDARPDHDGERTYDAGEAYFWPPGHNLEARTDAVYLEFSPLDQYDELMAHCARVMASM